MNIFVSYSKYDRGFLIDENTGEYSEFLRVLRGLDTGNVSVDIDFEFISAGDHWRQKILAKIEKCRILVPLLSDDFIQSSFCNDVEVTEVLKRRNAGNDILITPFYLRYCEWRKLTWVEERGIRPNGDCPFLSIDDPHTRTKTMIDFRAELETQTAILKGCTK